MATGGRKPIDSRLSKCQRIPIFRFNEPAWGVMDKYKDKMLEQNPTDNRRPHKRK